MKKIITLLFFISLIFCFQEAKASDLGILKTKLASRDEQSQMSAVEELGRMQNSEAVEELVKLVFSKSDFWHVKIRAIRILGNIPDRKVSDKLVTILNNPFLNEECPAIKWNTILALGQKFNKGSRAVDSLIEALENNDPLMREAIIQSLGKIGDPETIPFLLPFLTDRRFAIRLTTVKALGDIGDKQAIPFLKDVAVKEKEFYIKEAALSALKTIRPD